MNKLEIALITVAAALALLPQKTHGAASGLNNIPTADTAPHLTLVAQQYSTFAPNRKPDYFAGFKFGIDPWEKSEWRNRFELGTDGRLGADDFGPAVFHAVDGQGQHPQVQTVRPSEAELEAAGITPDKEIMCYCGTSREGSLLRFYLKHVAGYPKVRLYEGAWKEYVWLNNKQLPAETAAR